MPWHNSVQVLGDRVPLIRGGRLLGAHVSFERNVKIVLGETRIRRGVVVAECIRWAPLPMAVRAQLIASLVLPSHFVWLKCLWSWRRTTEFFDGRHHAGSFGDHPEIAVS